MLGVEIATSKNNQYAQLKWKFNTIIHIHTSTHTKSRFINNKWCGKTSMSTTNEFHTHPKQKFKYVRNRHTRKTHSLIYQLKLIVIPLYTDKLKGSLPAIPTTNYTVNIFFSLYLFVVFFSVVFCIYFYHYFASSHLNLIQLFIHVIAIPIYSTKYIWIADDVFERHSNCRRLD